MISNYLKIALRNLYRNKGYSSINIIGLAIGLAVSLVITFYVLDDLTYDRFHENPGSIYRMLTIENEQDNSAITYSITSGPLMVALNEGIPEILASTRTFGVGNVGINRLVENETADPANAVFGRGVLADSKFFEIFNFKILRGADASALDAPGNIWLTPRIAEALFGDEDPIGQPLDVPQLDEARVAGLVEAPPDNSHIKFDMIAPLRPELNPVWWDSWENLMLTGYVKLQENADPVIVLEKIEKLARERGYPDIYLPGLQPLLDIHMGSAEHRYDQYNLGKTDSSIVYALTIIGLLVLLIAAINFINLSTARASQRAREVGLRKVVGSDRKRLIMQFLGESIILTLFAMLLALLILEITRPFIIDILGKQINISVSKNPILLLHLFIVAVGIGILSGIYPALVLSGFKPITVLRGQFKTSKKGVFLRRVLVVCQFTATISLIAGVLIVLRQIDYLKNLDLGYTREQVVVIPNPLTTEEDLLKNELLQMGEVIRAGRASNTPGPGFLRIEVIPEGTDRSSSRMFQRLLVDEAFTSTLDIEIVAGRGFSKEISADRENCLLINETAFRMTGWDTFQGRHVDVIEVDGKPVQKQVVGIIRDVHFSPTRQSMEPMMFQLDPRESNLLYLRLAPGDLTQTMESIESKFKALYPDIDFNFFFLDDVFDRQFNTDRNFAANMGLFSGVAIFIACLGLLGLVSFTIGQRRREIAVRKVLGCSEGRIVGLLATDFLKWVALANLAAWPLTFYGMNMWLDGFIYQTPFSLTPFIIAGCSVLAVAAMTLSYQAIRAAIANPIKSLRYE